MKCKDYIVSGKMPNGTEMRVQCELKQIGMVKKLLKKNGIIADTITVKEDWSYRLTH